MNERIWKWNSFSDGIPEYAGSESGCSDMARVTTHSPDAPSACLSRAMESISGSHLTDSVRRIIVIPDTPSVLNPYLFALLADGNIWRFCQDGTGWTNVYGDAAGDIGNAILSAGRLFWTTGPYLNNIAIAGAHGVSVNAWGTSEVNIVNHSQRAFAHGGNLHPMIEFGGHLYIGDGNNIAMLDDTGNVFNPTALVLSPNETIMGITVSGSHIQIYTTNNGAPILSKKYLWDGSSSTPLGVACFDGVPVAAVANCNRMDALIAGAGNSLGICISEGYSMTALRKLGPLGYNSFVGNSPVVYSGDMLYIGGPQDSTLRVFDTVTTSRNRSIFPMYSSASGGSLDIFTALAFVGDDLFAGVTAVASGGATTYDIEHRSLSHYVASGYLSSPPYIGSGYTYRKTLREIIVAHTLPTGTSIEIRVSSDGGTLVSVATLTATTAPYTRLVASEMAISRDVSYVSIRAILSTTDPTVTPLLREIVVRYDEYL